MVSSEHLSIIPHGSAATDLVLCTKDAGELGALAKAAERAGYRAFCTQQLEDALDTITDGTVVAILDRDLLHPDRMDVISSIKREHPGTEVLVLSNRKQGSHEIIRRGAFSCLPRPCDDEDVLAVIEKAVRHSRLKQTAGELFQSISLQGAELLTGNSPASLKMLEQAICISDNLAPALITGEKGAGKSAAARLIHSLGNRSEKPFVELVCGAFPRDLVEIELFGAVGDSLYPGSPARAGLIEIAEGGTLFLDEIEEFPLELQGKLADFLDSKHSFRVGSGVLRRSDVRVIAASVEDLMLLESKSVFDHRLCQVLSAQMLEVPPLRERREDIPEFARQILKIICRQKKCHRLKITPKALELLSEQAWPENFRTLESILERAVNRCKNCTITESDLLLENNTAAKGAVEKLAGLSLFEIEKRALKETLKVCKGNKAAAARMLKISERSIYNKMKRLGIEE